jgi:hypothetical protein
VVRLCANTGRCSVRISVRTPAILNETFCIFLQLLQANVGIVSSLGQNRFLTNPFQFNTHLSSIHSMLHSLL